MNPHNNSITQVLKLDRKRKALKKKLSRDKRIKYHRLLIEIQRLTNKGFSIKKSTLILRMRPNDISIVIYKKQIVHRKGKYQ